MSESFSYDDALKKAAPPAGGFSYEDAGGEAPPRGLKGWAQDLSAGALDLAIGVPEAIVGLADIPTGGRVGKFLENEGGAIGFRPKEAREATSKMYSEATQAAEQKFQEAEGVVDKTVAAIQNPSVIAKSVGTSLGAMGAGGVAARGVLAATRLGQMGAKGAALAGAAGEGLTMAGSAAEQIRQETDDGLLTPAQSGLALATGLAGGAIGGASGQLQRRMGVGDVDTMLAQGAKGMAAQDAAEAGAQTAVSPLLRQRALESIPGKVITGAIAEGLLEELPQSLAEQLFQNVALGKAWHEELDSAAVLGALSGGAMGAGAAGYRAIRSPAAQQSPGAGPDALPAAGGDAAAETPLPTALDRVRESFAEQLGVLQQQEAGEPPVAQSAPPDGAAALAAQQARAQSARDAAMAASRAEASPDDEIYQSTGAAVAPSVRMGLDPSAGSLSAGAAIAVDTGATQQVQQAATDAALAEAGEKAAKAMPAAKKTAVQQRTPEVDPATGEVLGGQMATWTDEQLSGAFRAAQGRDVRVQLAQELAQELARRRAVRAQTQPEQSSLNTGTTNGPEADQAQQAAPQRTQEGAPAAAVAAGTTAAGRAQPAAPLGRRPGPVADAAPPQNAGAQAAPAASAQGPAPREGAEQRAQRITEAGAAWTRMTGPERQAVAERTDVKPVIKKNLARGAWDNLNSDVKGKLAAAMQPAAPAEDTQAFVPETGTLGVPRSEMPQVPTQSHGGLVKHLNAQGIQHETTTLDAADLKPTQAEYSPAKVEAAKSATGDRAVIVSSDGHIIDGHHQALAAAEEGRPVKAIVLDAPVERALEAVRNSPSAAARVPQGQGTDAISERLPDALSIGEATPLVGRTDAIPSTPPASAAEPSAQPATKKASPLQRAKAKRQAIAEHFAPGNIVAGYGGGYERVVSFSPPDASGIWSVQVQAVERVGDNWRDVPGQPVRTHATEPSARELMAGPVEMAKPATGAAVQGPAVAARGVLAKKAAADAARTKPKAARGVAAKAQAAKAKREAKPVDNEPTTKPAPPDAEIDDVPFRRSDGTEDLTPAVAEAMRMLSAPAATPAARAQAVSSVQATVNAIRAAWGSSLDVVVAYDMNDPAVPMAARTADLQQRSGGAAGEPEGFYHGGTAYLLASRLPTAADAARVLAHEVLGHHGLRGRFGGQLDGVLNQIATMRQADVAAKIAEYGLRPSSREDQMVAAEEVLAEMAQASPDLGFVKRAVAAIRSWLRSNVPGMQGLELTDAEIIRSYILPARRFVERGGKAGQQDRDVSFSRGADQTQSEAFRSWFGDSKVVDSDGKPRVMYHGTHGDFNAFSMKKVGKRFKGFSFGLHFTSRPESANVYAQGVSDRKAPKGANVMPVYIRATNPLTIKTDQAQGPDYYADTNRAEIIRKVVESRRAGKPYDAVIIQRRRGDEYDSDNVIVFDPAQIKSATGNSGAFSTDDPDITHAGTRGDVRGAGTAADRAVMDMVREGSGAQDILRLVAGTSRSRFNKQVARLLLKTGSNPKVLHERVDLGSGGGFRFLAKYSRAQNALSMTDGAQDQAEQIFLHEMIHAATLLALDRKGLASLQMRRLHSHVKQQGGAVGQYGMKNVGEFVAEAFTNPEFQQALKGISAPSGSTLQSAWDSFLRILKRILGLPNDQTSALSQALELGIEVMRDTAALRRRGVGGAGRDAHAAEADDDAFFGAADLRRIKGSALTQIDQALNHPGTVSIWDKTVGTMRHLAQRAPAFKPVFQAAQQFIDDVAMLANDSANYAPRLLPRVEDLSDIVGKDRKKPISAEDNKAVARPLFEGTLMWARDVDGKAVLADDLERKYANLPTLEKTNMLKRAGKIDPGVLNMWQGLPIEQFEKLIDSRFQSQMLKTGVVWSDTELRDVFKATPQQISLYREARATIDRSLDMTTRADIMRALGTEYAGLRDAVLDLPTLDAAVTFLSSTLQEEARSNPDAADRIADLQQLVNTRVDKAKQLMKEGYAPLSRFGQYTVDVVDASGDRQYFGMFETKAEANQMRLRMQEAFPGAAITSGTMSREAFKLFAGITPESLEMFGNMLGLEGDGDQARDRAFQEYLKLAKNNHSALKRLIHRKGIAGYSEDVGRVLASFVYSNARQAAGGLNVGGMDQAINNIPKQEGELKDLAMGLRDYIKDPQEEGQAIRGMLFAQYLGGSLASAFVNMTQPFQVTLPWMSQYGGMRKASAQLARALKDMGTRGFRYEADLATALKAAEDDGVVSPQEIHQLMAQARGTGALRAGDGTRMGDARATAANAWTRTKVAWGQPFALAEQFNRRSTFIAAYRLAQEQGMQHPSQFARDAVLETQFLYTKANKPRWARGAVGGTLFTFKTYSVSYLELMQRMWTQGGPEGKRAVGWSMAMLLLMGGAGGLPFMEDLEDLIDGAGQMMGYNVSAKQWRKEAMRDVVGKEIADFIEQGVSGLPGAPVDVSGRLGMGNLLPGTGLLLSKQSRERDLLEVVGPAGDLVARGFGGLRKFATGDVGGAALEISPSAVRNAAKGVDMAASGIYKDTKGYKVIDTTLAEAAAKAIGFQPKTVAEVQEANSFMLRSKSFYTQTSSEIKAQWANALFTKDESALERVRERLADWNRNNPEQPITIRMPDIWKRVREMGKDRTDRIADTAPKALRGQMREMAADAAR